MESGSNWRFSAVRRVIGDVSKDLIPLGTLNVLWFLMSVTVILMPPATAALYEMAAQEHHGQTPSVRDYLSAIRRLFVKGWIWGIASGLVAALVWFAVRFYLAQTQPVSPVLIGTGLLILAVLCGVQFYFWPYMVLQEQPRMLLALKNALFTVLADPLLLVQVVLVLLLVALSAWIIFPFVAIVPVSAACLGVYSLRDWLAHHKIIETPA